MLGREARTDDAERQDVGSDHIFIISDHTSYILRCAKLFIIHEISGFNGSLTNLPSIRYPSRNLGRHSQSIIRQIIIIIIIQIIIIIIIIQIIIIINIIHESSIIR